MTRSWLSLLFIAGLTIAAAMPRAHAEDPLHGPEWTFTSEEFRSLTYAERARFLKEVVARQIRKACAQECHVYLVHDPIHGDIIQLTHSDGFEYQLSHDHAVIEVTANALILPNWRKKRDQTQAEIFNSLREIGLRPGQRVGGGHNNLGIVSAFGNDAELFQKYVVDLMSHEAVTGGASRVYPEDQMVQPISRHHPGIWQKWNIALKKSAENQSLQGSAKIAKLGRDLTAVLSYYDDISWKSMPLSLATVGDRTVPMEQWRVESRYPKPQADFDEYLLHCELTEARLAYLKRTPYAPMTLGEFPTSITNPQALFDGFYQYTTEAGLDFNRLRPLLRQDIRDLNPSCGAYL